MGVRRVPIAVMDVEVTSHDENIVDVDFMVS